MGGRAWHIVRRLIGKRYMRNIESLNQHDDYPQHHKSPSPGGPKKCHHPTSEELDIAIGGHSVRLARWVLSSVDYR